MTTIERRWRMTSEYAELHEGVAYSVATVPPGDGPLEHLGSAEIVAQASGTVLMLSASGGMLSREPEVVLARAAKQALDAAAGMAGPTRVLGIGHRILELYEDGIFCSAIPNGVVAAVSPEGEVHALQFGPVAAALVEEWSVNLLCPDERFPRLIELGVPLESLVPPEVAANPLVSAVSSLTRLGPDALIAHGQIPDRGSVMLMGRGAVPLKVPLEPSSLAQWSDMEAGWVHGMGGTVVQLYRRQSPPEWDLFPWLDEPRRKRGQV